MSTIEILHPAGKVQDTGSIQMNAIPSLKDGRVSVIDNGKPNFARLAAMVGEKLRASHGVAEISIHRKENPAVGATTAILDEVSDSADLVLCGSAD